VDGAGHHGDGEGPVRLRLGDGVVVGRGGPSVSGSHPKVGSFSRRGASSCGGTQCARDGVAGVVVVTRQISPGCVFAPWWAELLPGRRPVEFVRRWTEDMVATVSWTVVLMFGSFLARNEGRSWVSNTYRLVVK
jgi:hypothetical protein